MKLHLGCGKKYLDGFVHIDLADFEHIDFKSSIDSLSLSMFNDDSVSEIYCSHAFEYFDRNKAIGVLNEWNRVMKIGAKLFLTVPDFDNLIKIYLETLSLRDILGPLFGKWQLGDNDIYHKTTWNEFDLKKLLMQCGFGGIRSFNPILYLSSIDKEYDDYSLAFFPHMDRSGIQVSLALEGTKIQ